MNNTDWNLDGLDDMFFGPGHNASNKGRYGDIFDFSINTSDKNVVPPPPITLGDNFLSQVFKEGPTLEHMSFSQFPGMTSYAGASTGVLNSQRKQPVLSQPFSQSHKSPKSPRIGVVVPLTTPARNKKPLFRAPYRDQIPSSHSSQAPAPTQFSKLTRQESHQNVRKSTQRCSQQPTLESYRPHMSNEDLFSSVPRSVAVDTPASLLVPGVTPGGSACGILKLRPVTEIPQQYRHIFSFPYFNAVQSKVLDDVFYTDRPIMLCAPTGSGKTVIFELAIIRLLLQQACPPTTSCKIVYMAPMKALCSERYENWTNRFSPIGLKCMELTGDTEMDDYFDLQDVHVILTTPEKWDSMTRRWRDNRSLIQSVKLFLIDEIHLLNDSVRGATMEAVVSRMKTVQVALRWQTKVDTGDTDGPGDIRFVAVSATIPNVQDIAEWLGSAESPAIHHKMDESFRPVRLRKVVLGYPCSENITGFRFDLTLSYKLARVIQTYSEEKPTLVFCATRKGTVQAATILAKEAKFVMNPQHKQILLKYSNSLKDSKLRDMVQSGIGYHHAGLDMQDRKLIEELFTRANLPVLLATSTLAMGVNLPAHLVVVKSTEHYVMGVYQEYSEAQVLQMIGRAGRPQFDTTATAVIMTKIATKSKFDSLLNGTQLIESSLHEHLIEHLNAEIVLNTINDVSVALEWIKSTFLYIRVMKNPKHYGIAAGLSKQRVEQKLQELCLQNLNSLASIQLVKMDSECLDLKSTDTGRLMARYCVAFETMKNFHKITGSETTEELLNTLCSSREFSDIQLRTNEKKTLNALNKDKNRITIRFPMQGKIKTSEMKVNCLIQVQFGCMPLHDFALQQDTSKIFRAGLRVSRCLVEVLWQRQNFKALLNAVLLTKCFKAKLWESSRHMCRQLTGIGTMLSNALVNAGLSTFQKLEDTNPREIELIINRHLPFGNQVVDAVKRLPKYELSIEQSASYASETAQITVTVNLANNDLVQEKSTAAPTHCCVLLVGDVDNKVLYKTRLSDAMLLRTGPWSKRLDVRRAAKGEELSVNFISQDWVGLDVHSTYTPFYSRVKRVSRGYSESAHDGGDRQNASVTETCVTRPGRGLRENYKVCNHRCLHKDTCAHECCKVGIPVKTKAPVSGMMESYRQGLKTKLDNISGTTNCKRLKDHGGKYALQQFAYMPATKTKMTPTTTVAPPTPSGWDHLQLYEHRQKASDMWLAMDEDPGTNGYCFTEDQSLHDEDFVIEDFQDSVIGHLSDQHAVIDSEEDLPDSLPTITIRPRVCHSLLPNNGSYPVSSSRTIPQKDPVFNSDYGSSLDAGNVARQPFKFRKYQYGNVGLAASSATVQPKWGSVSCHSGSSPVNCAVSYGGVASHIGDVSVANAKDVSAKPVLHRRHVTQSPSENVKYKAVACHNIARGHGSEVTEPSLEHETSSTPNSETRLLKSDVDFEMGCLFSESPFNKAEHSRNNSAKNTVEVGAGSWTSKYHTDSIARLSHDRALKESNRQDNLTSSSQKPDDNDSGQFLLLGAEDFDDSDWNDDADTADSGLKHQELPGCVTRGVFFPVASPTIPTQSSHAAPISAGAADFFSNGNRKEEMVPDICDDIFAGIF